MLVLRLPTRPVGVRVKVWRRLRHLGAIAVKDAVYALPNRAETREDFEWVRAEVVACGGEATIFQASTTDPATGDSLRGANRRDRREDYAALVRSVDKAARAAAGQRSRDPRALARALRAWHDRLAEIEGSDYFAAEGREQARAAVARLHARIEGARTPTSTRITSAPLDQAAFQRRRWLTRPRPGVDRMASAWLIRRFIDPQAAFAFGEPGGARRPGTLTFDMFGGDFTHEGDRCTFEVLCKRFALSEPRLRDVAEVVHDLDLKDGRFGRVEAPVVGALVEGLRGMHRRDDVLLEQGIGLFEALYQGSLAPPQPSVRQRGARVAARARRAHGR